EEHDRRIVQQRRGDDHLPAHAFGVGPQQLLGQGIEAQIEEGDELLDAATRTKPTRRLTWTGSTVTSKSAMRAEPLVGSSIPVSIFRVVDLPAPFGPR